MCPGPGDVSGGVETIKKDESYYLFQIYDGFQYEEVLKKGYFDTPEGYHVEIGVMDDPKFIRHARVMVLDIHGKHVSF